ncbi:uncharacterized protein LOC115213595 isoform X1 [Argonauta hians]
MCSVTGQAFYLLLSQLLMFTCSISGFSIDHTLIHGNIGRKIAETVVILVKSQNILMEDYSFLRRLAIVQSNDGIPYRPDSGGIWRVTTSQLDSVQEACGQNLLSYCRIGQERFDVDVAHANYSELDKPLYSGYAMALYLLTIDESIPVNLTDQADYWKKYIAPDKNVTKFLQSTNIPDVPDQCRKPEKTTRNEVESYCLFQSPCTREAIALKLYFFAHSDPTRFIRCTEWGASYIQICVPGTVWSQINVTCLHRAGTFVFRRKNGANGVDGPGGGPDGVNGNHYLNGGAAITAASASNGLPTSLHCAAFCLLQLLLFH